MERAQAGRALLHSWLEAALLCPPIILPIPARWAPLLQTGLAPQFDIHFGQEADSARRQLAVLSDAYHGGAPSCAAARGARYAIHRAGPILEYDQEA